MSGPLRRFPGSKRETAATRPAGASPRNRSQPETALGGVAALRRGPLLRLWTGRVK
jgi:hypothetical protein